jgi:UDP-N-acetyl-D-mannosaminuronic acid dehydrogenase
VLPGRILVELVENDRVIGGQTPEASTAGRDLYQAFVTGHVHLTDATTAEMAKLMENTSRDVNIALANEFAKVAEVVGIDVFLKPGPGVGGHCIAVDPWFIVHAAPEQSEIIRTARQINDRQPEFVATLIEEELSGVDHPSIAVLGLAYKADVDDVRESPSIEVALKLRDLGFDLRLHDAHATRLPDGLELATSLEQALAGADLAVILTDHAEYRALQPTSSTVEGVRRKTIFDTRNCIDPRGWEDAGWRVRRLGASTPQQEAVASTKWVQA